MALSFVAGSVLQVGTTSLAIAAPTGTAIGDLQIIHMVNKLSSVVPTTPAGWDLVDSQVVGTGSDGVGTGPIRMTVFARIWSITPTSTTITITGGNVANGAAKTYRRASTDPNFQVNAMFGSDTSSGTGFATTQSAVQGFTVNDQVFAYGAVTANTTRSTDSVTVPGCTLAAVTQIESGGTATGNALYNWSSRTNVTAGSQTGAATTSATLAAASTGGAVVVRISIAPLPPIIVLPPRRS